MPFEMIRSGMFKEEVDATVFPDVPLQGGVPSPGTFCTLSSNPAACADKSREEGRGMEDALTLSAPDEKVMDGLRGFYDCCENSLRLALEHGCSSVAFNPVPAEGCGYPEDDVLGVAFEAVRDFLSKEEMMVYLVIPDNLPILIGEDLQSEISRFINRKYTGAPARRLFGTCRRMEICGEEVCADLADELENVDEGFSEHLFKLIREKGIGEVECYKRANVDRKLFSKIRSDRFYRVAKNTAVAFAVALKLDYDETQILLSKAGYTLSRSSRADIIVEYFIRNKMYDIFEINEALFSFDEALLGQR